MFSNIINMEKYLEILPEEVFNKMVLYYSHPIADLMREEIDKFVDDDDDLTEFSGLYFELRCNNRCNIHCKRYCVSCDYYYDSELCICCPRCD